MTFLRYDPLRETDGPVVPKCGACLGEGVLKEGVYSKHGDLLEVTQDHCEACQDTGLAQPPKCEECGGRGMLYIETPHSPHDPTYGDSDGPYDQERCPSCSGTGHGRWEVLIDRDVFWGDWIPIPEAVTEDCNAGYRKLLVENELASIFAPIASHPEMQFYLPIGDKASAERARDWFADSRRSSVDLSAYREKWLCGCGQDNYDAEQMGLDRCSKCGGYEDELGVPIFYPASVWKAMNTAKSIVVDWWPLKNLTLLAVAHDQPSLDDVLPAVLAVPAAAHGVWLKKLNRVIDLSTDGLSVLFVDKIPVSGWFLAVRDATAQAREAGVRVVGVAG